jgi:hypothetical protein
LLISEKLSFPTLEALADKTIRFKNFQEIEKKLKNINEK